jgi:hypothetical protein
MFEIVGRILTINKVSDKVSQVVIKKQVQGKQTPIAIDVFGFYKDKMEALKLMKNDKIQGRVFVKSNLYKGKWYTDFYFKDIKRYEPKPKYNPQPNTKPEHELFFEADEEIGNGGIGNIFIIDDESGEIIL